jgi:uncharacterized protein
MEAGFSASQMFVERVAGDYLQQFALPNFFFFETTAYNVGRHRGVPIGNRDFLGPVNWL